ncbi:MAG: hypothetical protein KatS3mg035_1487 [Bacteroidia bacterium]|nr:MAG: hypothetical protein KatS3mg035_1487 [Bacteroidia bacterium]
MLDVNIAPDYGKLKQMFEVVNFQENKGVLQTVLEQGYITAPLITQFSFSRTFGSNELINFLAYMGNLTMDGTDMTGRVRFKIPNKVIEELYWQYYAEMVSKVSQMESKSYKIDQSIVELAKTGEYETFFHYIQEVLQNLSNRDFMNFNEKQVKMVIIAYLMLANIFDVVSEREVQGGGYPDLLLFKKSNNPYDHHEFIIELKYLKKEQSSDLERVKQEAKDQVLNYYKEEKRLQNKPYLHLLAVVVIKDEVFVEEVKRLNFPY